MANKAFYVPMSSYSISGEAKAVGSVSGDVTSITSITYEFDAGIFSMEKGDFPKTMTIDGKQYKWTVNKTGKDALGDRTVVTKATVNIGTKLVINKPFFKVNPKYSGDEDGSLEKICSFYDLGNLVINPYWNVWESGADDFEINGKTSVPMSVENDDDEYTKLSYDATYRLSWSLGSKKYTVTKKLGTKGKKIEGSYVIPKSWNGELPSATYGYLTVKIESVFGSYVYQSLSDKVKASVPADCVPVINSVTLADFNNKVPSSWGMFIEENSNVGIQAIDVSSSYGSSISSVTMKVGDTDYHGTMSSYPKSGVFKEHGVVEITVTVKDKRGRTAEKTAKITVVEYSPPTLEADSMRCDSSGEIENEGTYFLATTSTEYSACNGKNKPTLTAAYKLSSASAYGTAAKLATGEAVETVLAGDLDTEFSYDVKYVLKDQFNTVTVIDYVSTAIYLMHFLHGGRGVAFGSKATMEGYVDFAFDAIFRGKCEFEKSNGETVTIQQIIDKLGL